MRFFVRALLLSGFFVFVCAALPGQRPVEGGRDAPLVLWYAQPAPIWDHALPVGNGRLGAMVFGGANSVPKSGIANNGDLQDAKKNAELMDGSATSGADEHLQLNEATVWQGSRSDRLNPKAHEAVPQIRKLLLDAHGTDGAKISAAEKLAQASMLGIPPRMPGYSTLGDLYLRVPGAGAVSDYRRQLDLDTGVVRVSYRIKGVRYTREVFASAPDHVIVMRITADQRGAVSFGASMDRPADYAVHVSNKERLVLREGPRHTDQIRFAGEVLVLPTGGKAEEDGEGLAVRSADSVLLLIAAATDFKGGPFPGGDPEAQCEGVLERARAKDFETLLGRHLADYQPLFRRTALHLGPVADPLVNVPTDERMRRVAAGADDLHLQEKYFQFARYLLISSSRAGSLPANLQGIWAAGMSNPWGSKWTVNVNTEMNYWPAEAAGLGETTEPLFDLIDMVRTPGSGTGKRVAEEYYGARGFVLHHNTDIWGDAEPIDGFAYGVWPMGGAWLSLQAWEHYAFIGDKEFLRKRAWPILHDASVFFLDYLMEDQSGHLVTGPSLSPENRYVLPDGTTHSLTLAPTMDIEIVRELFTRTIDAGRALGIEPEFAAKVAAARGKLPPFKVGALGQLQEWQMDYKESAPGHRHISHLWALFPGTQISVEETPELAKAARVTLERRLANGGGQTGWSRAWVVNYWDHLGEGEQAYESLQVLFRQSTFPNLMDTHPPGVFQIDGNLGAANGMLEAVLQSRWKADAAEVEFLPALPKEWAEGSVAGVRLRGGGNVDMEWKQGTMRRAVLHAPVGGRFRLMAPKGQRIESVKAVNGSKMVLGDGDVLAALKGESYEIAFSSR